MIRAAMIGLLLLCVLLPWHVYGQAGTIDYSDNYNLRDGLYLNFEEFKRNAPSVTEFKVISHKGIWIDLDDRKDPVKRIDYKDPEGNRKKLKEGDFWGMCHDGQPYYFENKRFHKILKVGMIMYLFVPYEYYPDVSNTIITNSGDITMNRMDDVRRLIDFRTGEIYRYSPKTLMYLIQDDPELLDAYMAIEGIIPRKQNILQFLHEYNARHPIRFPTDPEQPFDLNAATEIELQ